MENIYLSKDMFVLLRFRTPEIAKKHMIPAGSPSHEARVDQRFTAPILSGNGTRLAPSYCSPMIATRGRKWVIVHLVGGLVAIFYFPIYWE